MERVYGTEGAHLGERPTTASAQRLDLKALRLAVHGWWLGNPLVYKPGATDLTAVARTLASTGAASGSLVVSDLPAGSNPVSGGADAETGVAAIRDDVVHAVLILRPPVPPSSLGMATAQAVAEVAQAAIGRSCEIQGRWEVVLGDSHGTSRLLCHIWSDADGDFSLVDVRLALGQLLASAKSQDGQPASALFARPDWREVFLARALHALENRLRA